MNLNERRKAVLSSIMNSAGVVTIEALAKRFMTSKHTIRYDLGHIDDFLQFNGLQCLSRKPNVGINFAGSAQDKSKINALISKLNFYQYVLSPQERINAILHELVQRDDYTTIDGIAERLMVSRSTVIKSLKEVKKWLIDNQLELITSPKHGIKIDGTEKLLRRAIVKLLMEIVDTGRIMERLPASNVNTQFTSNDQFHNFFADIDIEYIETCIETAESDLETVFSDLTYSGLVIHLAMAIKRIRQSKDIVMPAEELGQLRLTKQFAVASKIAKRLEDHLNVAIPDDEVGYITEYMVSGNVASVKSPDPQIELQIVVCNMIEYVSNQLATDFSHDRQLFDGLMEHLRPTIYRLKNGFALTNPLLGEIKTHYCELYAIVKACVRIIADYVGKPLSDDETGYFVMHFGAALERMATQTKPGLNILVVCGSGIGTAQLLSSRLQAVFNVNIVDAVARHQVKKILHSQDVDLIVTTVPLTVENVTCIQVNPMLMPQDIEKLRAYIGVGHNTASPPLSHLLRIIEKSCDIIDHSQLVTDLASEFNLPKEKASNDKSVSLKELLTEETIRLDVVTNNWQEAVRVGGAILQEKGFISRGYINSMIDVIKNIGPYIVIGKGIALPHAQSGYGVRCMSMSLIRLKPPVFFGSPDNDPVDLVFTLAATDKSSHLRAFFQLSRILNDKDKLAKVRGATTSREITELIVANTE